VSGENGQIAMMTVRIKPRILLYTSKNYDFTIRLFANKGIRSARYVLNFSSESLAANFRAVEDALFTNMCPRTPIKKSETVRLCSFNSAHGHTVRLRPVVLDEDSGFLRLRSTDVLSEERNGVSPTNKYSAEKLSGLFKSGVNIRGQIFFTVESAYTSANRVFLLVRLCEVRYIQLEKIPTFWDTTLQSLTDDIQWAEDGEAGSKTGTTSPLSTASEGSDFDSPFSPQPARKRART
jgi:hypothetical protein